MCTGEGGRGTSSTLIALGNCGKLVKKHRGFLGVPCFTPFFFVGGIFLAGCAGSPLLIYKRDLQNHDVNLEELASAHGGFCHDEHDETKRRGAGN